MRPLSLLFEFLAYWTTSFDNIHKQFGITFLVSWILKIINIPVLLQMPTLDSTRLVLLLVRWNLVSQINYFGRVDGMDHILLLLLMEHLYLIQDDFFLSHYIFKF